jgi:hypothetical protein
MKWEDNIRMDLRKTGKVCIGFIQLRTRSDSQAPENTIINLWVL